MDNRKKYDVGITGYWWSTNYGSVATYYALYKLVEDAGLRPVFIDRPENNGSGEGNDVFSRRFMAENAEISESFKWDEVYKYNELCDTFVIGSDQVWTSTSVNIYKYFFFLDFADDDKNKIAYASSFGETFNVDESISEKAGACLKRFSNISVREFQAADICQKQLGIKADWVMDPVFLPDKKYWSETAAKAKRKTADILGEDRKYLLTYILNPSDEKREIVKETARRLGLPVICILDGRKGTFEENNKAFSMENTIQNASEEEWLYFFENADYIVTDSQHGTAFSILLNKQFICCSNKKWGQSRYESLLGLTGLRDRQKTTLKAIESAGLWDRTINYEKVSAILDRRVKYSREWLYHALGFDTERIKKETVEKVRIENRCSGCSACEKICPRGAVAMRKDVRGFIYPDINAGKCVLCGMCLKKCVNENPVYVNNEAPECYAMMASDKQRSISSSGGMFTVAAEYIIDNGGYVCGAAFRDDFSVHHIIVDKKEELEKLRGSKYMQSDMENVYPEIKKLLDDGKTVLFTGMPCQTAGLNSYLGKKYDNLYTIDLLCHGITSTKVFEKYRRDVLEDKKLTDLKFKAKKPWGWHAGVNALFEDGTKYSVPLQTDPYFIAYLKSISKNRACELCRSSALPRQADLTMGDFWGIPKNDPEMHDKKGTSVVLVNSENGARLFEELKPFMKKWKKEPLEYAINNNKVIIRPYNLHKNHDAFFENFGELSFEKLTSGCFFNRLYDEQKTELLKTVPENEHELYYLAKTVSENAHGRKIVIWGRAPKFEAVLSKYFGISAAFSVVKNTGLADNVSVFPLERVKGRASEYYIAALEAGYSDELYGIMEKYGYSEGSDFIFRRHRPVVLENIDLSKGMYSDMYGNTIEGYSGIIPCIAISGCNNHIILGEGVKHTENLSFDITSNSYIRIGKGCNFTGELKIEVRGFSGSGRIVIGDNCKFMDGEFRLFTSPYNSSVLINEGCTFGKDIELHANSGKKIIIGKDCMFSMGIDIWAGDGHSVFDVNTGKNINSVYNTLSPEREQVFIGEHVWAAKGAFIMHGTNIGSGSIIGAKSVVKGVYPNNCSVAGNPAKLIKKDIAWSREMSAAYASKCIDDKYFRKTLESRPSVSGMNVLVVGGTKIMGKQLVKELIRLGNNVTIATRGKHKDDFGADVNRLVMDVSDAASARKALKGKYFDVVFDNLAYCSNYADNVLSNVKCGRYVQLSSVEVYRELSMDISESSFEPESTELVMCSKKDVGYVEGKRQAEALVYQKYSGISAVTVRLPFIVPTTRLSYYYENIINEKPMNISDISRAFTFARDTDVGAFLPWIAAQEYCGPVNFSSKGFVTVGEIIEYIEQKTGKKAVIKNDASLPQEPFIKFNESSYSMSLDRLVSLNYRPSVLKDWFWKEIDRVCGDKM